MDENNKNRTLYLNLLTLIGEIIDRKELKLNRNKKMYLKENIEKN